MTRLILLITLLLSSCQYQNPVSRIVHGPVFDENAAYMGGSLWGKLHHKLYR